MGIGDWGLGIGDWGLGGGRNPQAPIPNPQSPIPNPHFRFLRNNKIINKIFNNYNNFISIVFYKLFMTLFFILIIFN